MMGQRGGVMGDGGGEEGGVVGVRGGGSQGVRWWGSRYGSSLGWGLWVGL